MTSEIVQGKAAWARLKKGSKSWDDWKTVGTTLLEGRAIAMRSAGTTSPAGRGYSDAFNEWLTCNRFDIGPSHQAKLLVAMVLLPEIENWRATLPLRQRLCLNNPGAVLFRYRKATGIIPAPAPAPV